LSANAVRKYFPFQAILDGEVRNVNRRLSRAPVGEQRDTATEMAENQTRLAAERMAEERR
jgi:hypothetical protein